MELQFCRAPVSSAQASICSELLRRLAKHHTALVRAMAAAAEVDCLISMAVAARDNGWCRPVLTADNVLEITQGADMLLRLLRQIRVRK